jgi:cobalt-zinc-cadmium efflux system protein
MIIVISEISCGVISNSYALISDALHNAGDILALVITYLTLKYGSGKTNNKATFINTLFLYLTMFYIIYESILKLQNPQTINASYMIIVGFVALVANGISAYLLNKMQVSTCPNHNHNYKHHHEKDNISSAYLHMLADALISIGVVIGGVVIYFYQIYFIDSILSIIFSIFIL